MALSGNFFDATYYLTQNADVAANWTGTPLAHYEAWGAFEGRMPNSWFDATYYRANNADLQSMNAVELYNHYETFGYAEGRVTSSTYANFDEEQYLEDYSDLGANGITAATALNHYLTFGVSESRVAKNDDGTTITGTSGTTGETYTLTTAVDVLTGSGNDDTFTATNTTLNTGDSITGGAGTDTLNAIFGTGAAPLFTTTGVETIAFTTGVTALGGGAAINAGNWAGVSTVGIKGSGAAIADSVIATGAGNVITGLAGNVTFDLDDLTVGTANHAVLAAQFASDALGSTTANLALDVKGLGTSTKAANVLVDTQGDDKITTMSLATSGSNYVQLEGASAAEISLKSITVTGDGKTTLSVDGTNAVVSSLATVDASGLTGNLTANISASTKAVTYTGGSGKDTITFGNGNNTIAGNDGNDTFTIGSGTNNVTGGAGDDAVIGKVAEFTTGDTIDLGDGTGDALIYSNVTTLNSTGVSATNLTALKSYSGIEVVGSSAANVTAIDADYFTQTSFVLSGANTKAIAMSDITTGDVLTLKTNIAADDADALTLTGSLPNQSVTLNLNGASSVVLYTDDDGATDSGLTVDSGISTVNINSTTSATSTTGLTNGISGDADATLGAAATTSDYSIVNTSAASFVLTGDVDFTIDNGATAGFSAAVDFNASAFTGDLTLFGSASADVIKGGSGDDAITGLAGNDQIDFSTASGGVDTVNFTGDAGTNGKDTITGFVSGEDKLSFDTLTNAAATSATALAAGAQVAITDAAVYVATVDGTAGNLTTGGTDTITDFTSVNDVDDYIAERFDFTAANDDNGIIILNDSNSGNAYIYEFKDAVATNTAFATDGSELFLIGVVSGATVTINDIA